MNILFSLAHVSITRRGAAPKAPLSPTAGTVRLTRTFVETGDERCPLAGIWSRIVEGDAASDDPQLSTPALRKLSARRAFYLPLTIFA